MKKSANAVNDMVLDHNMNPAYIRDPSSVKDWLVYQLDIAEDHRVTKYFVRLGATMKVVSVREYLDRLL